MDIVIIGGGASGCFAAANIVASPGDRVVVLERSARILQKVRVSGGGRCNVTHEEPDIQALLQCYPRGKAVLKKSLNRFTPEDTVGWFAQRQVPLKTEADGRMFPTTDDSETIIRALTRAMERNGVEVRLQSQVVSLDAAADGFRIGLADGAALRADKIIIACGGFPKQESYDWIGATGHALIPPVPSLFTFNLPGHSIVALSGVSVPDARVQIEGTKIATDGPVLITHWGLSGPAVLRASAWAARALSERQYRFRATISWLGELREPELKERIAALRSESARQLVSGKPPFEVPRRLWEFLVQEAGIGAETRWAELPSAGQNKLTALLLRHPFEVQGKTTFKEEFVTCGGVSLQELDPETMESRRVPGLYFTGEVIDVDGITGGFNFQHAWSSGWLAAKHINAAMRGNEAVRQ